MNPSASMRNESDAPLWIFILPLTVGLMLAVLASTFYVLGEHGIRFPLFVGAAAFLAELMPYNLWQMFLIRVIAFLLVARLFVSLQLRAERVKTESEIVNSLPPPPEDWDGHYLPPAPSD